MQHFNNEVKNHNIEGENKLGWHKETKKEKTCHL